MDTKRDIKSLNIEELKEVLKEMGEPLFRAGQIFSWLHEKKVTDFSQMTNLSKDLREKLKLNFDLVALKVAGKLESEDGTVKFLFELSDGQIIESVLMCYKHGYSVCVSSQVGCRMGCKFCASTIDGVIRNLTASEILDQVYSIERICEVTVSNVVIMGSGEPMDNYENCIRFIRLISDEKGKNMSARNVTVSTCGLIPGINRLAEEGLPVTLALSLHAPNDELRKTIMPVANSYKINDVIAACDNYFEKTSRRMTYEYSMIDGVNDTDKCAMELAGLLKGKNCHVNLIPINSIKERDFIKASDMRITKFKNLLEKSGINVTIRRSMGSDIDAACGQLRRRFLGGEI